MPSIRVYDAKNRVGRSEGEQFRYGQSTWEIALCPRFQLSIAKIFTNFERVR